MIYVTALLHPKASGMWKTTFLCRNCNRTWSYMLSTVMTAVYAAAHADALSFRAVDRDPSTNQPTVSDDSRSISI